MKIQLLEILKEELNPLKTVTSTLSLRPFLDSLQQLCAQQPANKLLHFVYHNLNTKLQEQGDIRYDTLAQYQEELQYIYNLVGGISEKSKSNLWALSTPIEPKVFFGTEQFYALVESRFEESFEGRKPEAHAQIQLYSLVLDRLYGFKLSAAQNIVYSVKNKEGDIIQFLELEVDYSYVDIQCRGELPKLKYKSLDQKTSDINWPMLQEMLPLDQFNFTGFSIVKLTDVTLSHAMSLIKDTMLDLSNLEEHRYFDQIANIIRICLHNKQVKFNIFPLLQLNSKLIFDVSLTQHSVLFRNDNQVLEAAEYEQLARTYIENPLTLMYNVVDELENVVGYFKSRLNRLQISSYLCTPLYYNKKLTGFFELYVEDGSKLDKAWLSELKVLVELLAQLCFEIALEFDSRINDILLEKFTPIQPAVRWKFNEVAAAYLKDNHLCGKEDANLQDVSFQDIYPLYGAIDVRNSTVTRNTAQYADLNSHLKLLTNLLKAIASTHASPENKDLRSRAKHLQAHLDKNKLEDSLLNITEFFQTEVKAYLRELKGRSKEIEDLIIAYQQQTNPQTGIAYANINNFENSLSILNHTINQRLKIFEKQCQEIHPCYFDKFRTDGVEHNIFIGESISKGYAFDVKILANIRQLQLAFMVDTARLVRDLKPSLRTALDSTYLLYISASKIDVSFRLDERRFDVEGSYNTRYEIVKKRIDKICIKDSGERLTQPDHVAIIYTNKQIELQYKTFIKALQQQGLVQDQIENLDLEEVQGIGGLKALRIRII